MTRRSLDVDLDDDSLYGVELRPLQSNLQGAAGSEKISKAQTRRSQLGVRGKVKRSSLKIRRWLRIAPQKDRKWIEPKDDMQMTRKQRIFRKLHGGWRTGVALGALGAIIVLFINIILLIWIKSDHPVSHDGAAIVFEGNCDKKTKISLWWHLAINVCSTLLLSASNNAMQCLTAPTRADIDKAHGSGRWLDVGIPSLKNLRAADSKRIALWCVLALSSIPLHLLYNSVVSTTLQVNDYDAVLATSGFVSGNPWNHNASTTIESYSDKLERLQQLAMRGNGTGLKHMDPSECVQNYSSEFNPKWGSLIVTLDETEADKNKPVLNAFLYHVDFDDHRTTLCETMDSACKMSAVRSNITSGRPWNIAVKDQSTLTGFITRPVVGCYAEEVTEHCKVTFNVSLLGIVIVCNILKAVAFIMILALPGFRPLITVGDAICSLLKQPDPTTNNTGLASSEAKKVREQAPYSTPRWKSQRCHWFCGASMRQWSVGTMITFLVTVPTTVLFLMYRSQPFSGGNIDGETVGTIKQLWLLGIGNVHTNTLITLTSSSIGNALAANTPQLALSSIYVSYNLLLTSMRMTAEYNQFASKRKSLRVSEPEGYQRAAYYLQLPYRYAVPLVIASGLLHWLVSQSLFSVNLNVFDIKGIEQPSRNVSACGWSPIAILFTLILLGVMIAVLFGLGWRKYNTGMPIMRSNSQDISAACHMPVTDPNAPLHPIAYGATSVQGWQKWHACFTDKEVVPLMRKYDGQFRLDVLGDDGDDNVGEVPEDLLGLRRDFPPYDLMKFR